MNLLIPFQDPEARNCSRCGGKGASLARAIAAGLPVPEGAVVTAAAFQAWQQTGCVPESLPAEIDRWLAAQPPGLTFAVRSSATAEDGAQHAFAGQHETFLNVPREAVLPRVLDCWRSRDGERAVEYRRRAGLSDDEVLMAVVIQQMIPSDCAGVAFGLDPVGGDPDHVVVDASFGVGETVVGGEYPVDHYTLRRADGAVVSAQVARKGLYLALGEEGTVERTSPAPEQPACTPEQLAAVADLLRRVEAHGRCPQDVEWAFQGGRLHLLQARPITRVPEHWTREESAERFPNPVSRLSWELVDEGFHRSLAHSFELMGLPRYEGRWFGRFDQYVYGQQTAVELYGRLAREALPELEPGRLPAALDEFRERFAWVGDLPGTWSRDLDTFLMRIGAAEAEPAPRTLAEAWQRVRQLQQIGSEYFLPNIAISITQRTLTQLLLKVLTAFAGAEKGAALHADLLAWCDTKTARVNQDLWELARRIAAGPHGSLLAEQGGAALLASGWPAADPTAYSQLEHILRVHGHREWDFDPYVAPWRETPALVLEMVRGLLGRSASPAEEGRAARQRMQRAELAALTACPTEARFFLSELIRLARTYTSLDDVEHYQTLRLNLPMRRALRELGAFFVAEGSLDEPLDVSFASCALVEERVAGRGSAEHFRREVEAEKARYRQAAQTDPVFDRAAPTARRTGALQGLAGSPGQATGTVQQVRSPEDFARFRTGSVLVARTTNPAWTPLFFRAAAVVTESGGPLSHGAVTAREIGIPAVMAVPHVFEALREGATVTVFGTQGRVELA